MKYNQLEAAKQTKASRPGRGISAGRGKTAGRGTKGQGSRKSGGVRPGFEGGQMPLYMRIPKIRGFKSHRTKPEVVYTGQLEQIKKTTIDSATLADAGLISSAFAAVKVVQKGNLTAKKEVKLQVASKNAQQTITKAGGSFEKVPQLGRLSKKSDGKIDE